jgi:hypothetical protein
MYVRADDQFQSIKVNPRYLRAPKGADVFLQQQSCIDPIIPKHLFLSISAAPIWWFATGNLSPIHLFIQRNFHVAKDNAPI